MSRELVEVNLSTPDDAVQQLWSTDTPWPLFTDNGTTKATLIEIGARPNRQPRPRRDLPPVGNLPAAGEGVKALNPAGATEEALATIQPWSGYWWPIHEGRLLEPLGKYDTVTGHRAADWERQNNPPGPEVPQWHGYCHAWAAASVLEKEPTKDQMERSVALSVGDQKGLLTAMPYRRSGQLLGRPFRATVKGARTRWTCGPTACGTCCRCTSVNKKCL